MNLSHTAFQNIPPSQNESVRAILLQLLAEDLDFHDQASDYASHDFHAFPAKFPPQLPLKFIKALTVPGDVVLDPMLGSGTTLVEAYLTDRRSIGLDIDPLALQIACVKTTPLDPERIAYFSNHILISAVRKVASDQAELAEVLARRWDDNTRDFVGYWFALETQVELLALIQEIEQVDDPLYRAFFGLALSAIIITKSGGVSMAFDLAHTRPHRAKIVIGRNGEIVLGDSLVGSPSRRIQLLTKTLRSPLKEFERRVQRNCESIESLIPGRFAPDIHAGDAQTMPLEDESIDLIVTSPPYASNAIDYMRAHKFSLVWLGRDIAELGDRRRGYIGGESTTDVRFEPLPPRTAAVVEALGHLDPKKGLVLHRYYSEMTRVLREIFRVLKPGKAALVVVGNSVMRGRDTETQQCLAEIGQVLGFDVPAIGLRHLDRDRRMLPAAQVAAMDSQIEQRMLVEYIIGFYKPHPAERS
ncbi:MAG: site-specific DNA-methyltransferase [Ardenticatenales bacterium]|nr:site-specific DNA-methyltransferase [Ardenticatenales bacterium]